MKVVAKVFTGISFMLKPAMVISVIGMALAGAAFLAIIVDHFYGFMTSDTATMVTDVSCRAAFVFACVITVWGVTTAISDLLIEELPGGKLEI